MNDIPFQATAERLVQPVKPIKKILIANRGEIAVRINTAAHDLGIETVGIYTLPDEGALHTQNVNRTVELKIQRGQRPTDAHLDIAQIIRIAKETGADAIHPGYGFLAENDEFAEACERARIKLIGPRSDAMRALGSKVSGRRSAQAAGLPVAPGSEEFEYSSAPHSASDYVTMPPEDIKRHETRLNSRLLEAAEHVGFPLVVKSIAGGGGRGIRIVMRREDLLAEASSAASEALKAFGDGRIFLEKLIQKPRHLEAQVLADEEGNVRVVGWRDCTAQWRRQKVVEESAEEKHLSYDERRELEGSIIKMIKQVGYTNACTVEFLKDQVTGNIYFGEVNTRIQVEHPVTEEQHGVDLVGAQILIAQGHPLRDIDSKLNKSSEHTSNGHAIEVRVTARRPANEFGPATGTVNQILLPSGMGIRVEQGIARGNAVTGQFDPLIAKIIAKGQTRDEAITRMLGALRDFHVDGVDTDAAFMAQLIDSPEFREGAINTLFVTDNLNRFVPAQDDILRLMDFIADQSINFEDERAARRNPRRNSEADVAKLFSDTSGIQNNAMKKAFESEGPEGYVNYLLQRVQEGGIWATLTDWRDAWQSKWATRHGLSELLGVAANYVGLGDQIKSVESFGGATDESALLFRRQHPFKRHRLLDNVTPNIIKQMLFRSSNVTGYASQPDNVVDLYVEQAKAAGVTVFRNFCPFNNIENMRGVGNAILRHGGVWEAAICLKADAEPHYYAAMALELAKAGAHILTIKDMSGEAKPDQIKETFAEMHKVLRDNFPEKEYFLSFHTHDTAAGSVATCLAAIEGGANSIDAASDALSGGTSQPSMGTLLHYLPKFGIDSHMLAKISGYYEKIISIFDRFRDTAAENLKSKVFLYGIPGGQLSNMGAQARTLGVRDENIDKVYEQYNEIKKWLNNMIMVTPTSKATGDLAIMTVLYMQQQELTTFAIEDMVAAMLQKKFSIPPSFQEFIRGDMGLPCLEDRNHLAMQREYKVGNDVRRASIYDVVLGDTKPHTQPASQRLKPADLDAEKEKMDTYLKYEGDRSDLALWMVHNGTSESSKVKPFQDMVDFVRKYGKLVEHLPADIYYDGLKPGQTVTFRNLGLLRGQKGATYTAANDNYQTGVFGDQVVIKIISISPPEDNSPVQKVVIEANGRHYTKEVVNKKLAEELKADARHMLEDPNDVKSPMNGQLILWNVEDGALVKADDPICLVDSMKVEFTIRAPRSGRVTLLIKKGDEIKLGQPYVRIVEEASVTSLIQRAEPAARAGLGD